MVGDVTAQLSALLDRALYQDVALQSCIQRSPVEIGRRK